MSRGADNTIMKRVIAITAALLVGCASWAAAQATTSTPTSASSTGQSIADVAKAEEARRKGVRKPAKVYTNGDLRTDISSGVAPAPPTAPATTPGTPSNGSPAASGAKPPAAAAGDVKDQAYWAGRVKALQTQIDRTQIFMDSLQSRINALTTDFVNRDDPAQRAKIETERNTALAELERVKKELDEQKKAVTALEDEARRAGVPPGWLRPGV